MLLTELSSLEIELHHPGVLCTPERLEEILHADFFEVGRSGNQYDRATVIRFLLSQHQPPSVESVNFAVHELGQDHILLTYRQQTVSRMGRLSTLHYVHLSGPAMAQAGNYAIIRAHRLQK